MNTNMNTKENELIAKFDEAIELAYAALELAQQYAGGESKTADILEKKIGKLVRSVKN